MKEKVLRGGVTPIPNIITSNMISMTKALLEKTNASKINQATTNLIEFPSWYKDRSFLSWDFYPNPEKFEAVFIQIFILLVSMKSRHFFSLPLRIQKSISCQYRYKKK